eukprot:2104300-Pleurochrysis_carterae.AAC.8
MFPSVVCVANVRPSAARMFVIQRSLSKRLLKERVPSLLNQAAYVCEHVPALLGAVPEAGCGDALAAAPIMRRCGTSRRVSY